MVFQAYELSGDHKTTLVLNYCNIVFLYNLGAICDLLSFFSSVMLSKSLFRSFSPLDVGLHLSDGVFDLFDGVPYHPMELLISQAVFSTFNNGYVGFREKIKFI